MAPKTQEKAVKHLATPPLEPGSRYIVTDSSRAAIEAQFTYHKPFGNQAERFVAIRDKAKELALVIAECTPVSADQNAALRKIREAVMTANAAIAINEVEPAKDTGHTGGL